MSDELQQAIDAIEAGDKETGQRLLFHLTKAEPNNIQAWLWLAQTEEDDDLRRQCYERVLNIAPGNFEAREALGVSPKPQPRAEVKDVDTGSGALHGLFAIAAVLLGLVAWAFVSNATMGVAIIGAACLCGILARIAQADHHQKNSLKMLGRLDKAVKLALDNTPDLMVL